MMFVTLPVIVFSSFMFTRLFHPLSMGLILLSQTCLMCVTAGLMTQSFWFSYILFLIFLGGLLVLFIYVASLASNEPFSLSTVSLNFVMTMILFLVMSLLTDTLLLASNLHLTHSSLFINMFNQLELVGTIYSMPSMTLTLYLVVYLLLTLLVAVKITNNNLGPLRLATYDLTST
uniref:NADH-ubiquinone oxidoreductase chain 6 n=1 Tax=Calocaris macandreae TaxID=1267412 RepID=L0EAN1_CALMF|nr:NADH dehydrogenase subunit 6 [Calocaris macandreae]